MAKSSIKQSLSIREPMWQVSRALLPRSLKESSMPHCTAFALAVCTNLVNFSSFRKEENALISEVTVSTAVTKSISSL